MIPYFNEGEAETLGNSNTTTVCLVAANPPTIDFGDSDGGVGRRPGGTCDEALVRHCLRCVVAVLSVGSINGSIAELA